MVDVVLARGLVLALGLGALLAGCGAPEEKLSDGSDGDQSEVEGAALAAPQLPELAPREDCADATPTRRALFGDLHVHTAYSSDAFVMNTRTTPDGAYRFAKGETIEIGPLDADGLPTYPVRLARPLDFAAVTDHAEYFGSTSRCTRLGSPAYDSRSCVKFRGELDSNEPRTGAGQARFIVERMNIASSDEVCGEDGRLCRMAGRDVWQEMIDVAELHYDRSSKCAFTTFVAYEYGLTPKGSKVHRNVIFRNERVLDYAIHAQMETSPVHLWRRLRQECIEDRPGCDVLAIPHNANLSDDRMFALDYENARGLFDERRIARLRASMEPLVEIMQVKGDSECRNGLWGVGGAPDVLCQFEKTRDMGAFSGGEPVDCRGTVGQGALAGAGCVGRDSYVRPALVKGLAEQARLGVNPLRFGFIGSTDEHKGPMGDVEEWAPVDRPIEPRLEFNPGGLMGVWAEANDRDSIFDAMRRRETFATSGPRIRPRFFGGWDLDPGLCDDPDWIARAYEEGVPMGGILPERPEGATGGPGFAVAAMRDPGTPEHPGNSLDRIQIIKGWVGEDGLPTHRVYEVMDPRQARIAMVPEVDLNTCEVTAGAFDSMCGVWTDPDFEVGQHAVYYARVVENPSCRWSTRTCNALEGDPARPAACDDPRIPKTVRERAWTSPIWFDAVPAG